MTKWQVFTTKVCSMDDSTWSLRSITTKDEIITKNVQFSIQIFSKKIYRGNYTVRDVLIKNPLPGIEPGPAARKAHALTTTHTMSAKTEKIYANRWIMSWNNDSRMPVKWYQILNCRLPALRYFIKLKRLSV